jgi:hypothetical protein
LAAKVHQFAKVCKPYSDLVQGTASIDICNRIANRDWQVRIRICRSRQPRASCNWHTAIILAIQRIEHASRTDYFFANANRKKVLI